MRRLKIAFAMGGGVSLGTFSGAALTESLKLLLLYGQDTDGNPYQSIEVDAMSGASAGAISLAILIRTLIDYESMIELLPDFKNSSNPKEEIYNRIKETYISNKNSEHAERTARRIDEVKEQLIALEVAQEIQRQCWVEGNDSDGDNGNFASNLFGRKIGRYYKSKLTDSYGLLDRGVIERLSAKYLCRKIENVNPVIISSQRILYACSLTNLAPCVKKEKLHESEALKFKLLDGLADATRSSDHKDLRVFDFQFGSDVKSDSRWIRIKNDASNSEEKTFALNDDITWNTVAATAIACGAFPVAFEPILLKRYKYEFANEDWPQPFNEFESKNYKNNIGVLDHNNNLDYSTFNFPYVDGGTLNNEPIKEAFKLANFIDYTGEEEKPPHDRIVIFIDPIVPQTEQNLNNSSYKPVVVKDKFANGLKVKNDLMKFLDNASSMVSMLRNQSTIKEENKINSYFQNRDLFTSVSDYYKTATIDSDSVKLELLQRSVAKLESFLNKNLIPPGTRSTSIYLETEIQKHSRIGSKCRKLTSADVELLVTSVNESKDMLALLDDLKTKVSIPFSDKDINELVKVFFVILSDITIGSAGKDDDAMRIAILPVNDDNEIIDLLGSELFGFGGFSSNWTRRISFTHGRKCTYTSLTSREFRESFHFSKGNFEFQDLLKLHDSPEYLQYELGQEDLNRYRISMEDSIILNGYKRAIKSFLPDFKTRFSIALFMIFPRLLSGVIRTRYLSSFAEKQIYDENKALLISILSDSPLKRTVKFKFENAQPLNLKMQCDRVRNDGKYRYYFCIYLHLQEEKTFTFVTNKRDKLKDLKPFGTSEVETIGGHRKIRRITFKDRSITSIPDIGEDKGSLHWYLTNIDSHVNPMLEIDVDDGFSSWYFREGTVSYALELGEKQKAAAC